MAKEPGWREWELYLQQVLELDDCIASGAKWYDQGDGVTREHYKDSIFPLVIDAKYTENKSFSITEKLMKQWFNTACDMGKRFLLPIRIWQRGATRSTDLVVMGLDDFVELLSEYRRLKGEEVSRV